MGIAPHRNPINARHRDRRSGHQSRLLREAFGDQPWEDPSVAKEPLAPEAMRQAKAARARHASRRGTVSQDFTVSESTVEAVAEIGLALAVLLVVFLVMFLVGFAVTSL